MVACLILVLPLAWLGYQAVVEPYAPSAFYEPPPALPAGKPGTIVRQEPITSSSPDIETTRVLYTSTDASGTVIAVSGIVAAPTTTPPPGGWPVVAWAHGTTGIQAECAPSLEPHGGVDLIPELEQLVAAGNVVVATDYPGLGTPGPHPYLIGESEGRAVLDSIRAARSVVDGRTSRTGVIFGHSQGGHAVLFAAQLAATYSPELDIVGAAAMAPPTDLGQLLERDRTEPSGLVLTALAISSWSRLYPQAREDAVVHVAARPFVADIGNHCTLTTTEGELSELPAVVALRVDFLSADPRTTAGWDTLLADNSPTAVQTVPLLIAQGLADTMVRPDITHDYVESQCASGATIEYDTYADVGHFQLRTVAANDVVTWLRGRLAAQQVEPACSTNARS